MHVVHDGCRSVLTRRGMANQHPTATGKPADNPPDILVIAADILAIAADILAIAADILVIAADILAIAADILVIAADTSGVAWAPF